MATAALVVMAISGAAAQRAPEGPSPRPPQHSPQPSPQLPPQRFPQRLPQWREAPEYLRQFAPAGARAAAYRIFVSSDDIDTALSRLNIEPASPDGPWVPRPIAPLDAFGQGGRYDRSRVARLYASSPPRVARGTTAVEGVTEFWTLISPHPDAGLVRLEPGTLLLVLRYDGADPGS